MNSDGPCSAVEGKELAVREGSPTQVQVTSFSRLSHPTQKTWKTWEDLCPFPLGIEHSKCVLPQSGVSRELGHIVVPQIWKAHGVTHPQGTLLQSVEFRLKLPLP